MCIKDKAKRGEHVEQNYVGEVKKRLVDIDLEQVLFLVITTLFSVAGIGPQIINNRLNKRARSVKQNSNNGKKHVAFFLQFFGVKWAHVTYFVVKPDTNKTAHEGREEIEQDFWAKKTDQTGRITQVYNDAPDRA